MLGAQIKFNAFDDINMSSALFPDMFNKCVGASKKEFVVHMLHVTRPHNIRPLQGKRDSKIMFKTITVLLFL